MRPVQYGAFHALMQKMAASEPGSWLLGRVLRYIDPFIFKLTRGRTTAAGLLAGIEVVLVTTTGARTGRPRTSPLLPVWEPEHPDAFALIASNWGQHRFPSWYFNLKKNPRAACLLDGESRLYAAHEAAGEEYERFWRHATEAYFGYRLYQQRAGRRIPIVVLTPLEA